MSGSDQLPRRPDLEPPWPKHSKVRCFRCDRDVYGGSCFYFPSQRFRFCPICLPGEILDGYRFRWSEEELREGTSDEIRRAQRQRRKQLALLSVVLRETA